MEQREINKPLKFVVLDESGRRSGYWSIKTAKNSDDIFLWERSTAEKYKLSLHNEPTVDPETTSRPWRLAMTREYSEAESRPREVLWEDRPAPFIAGAWLAPRLVVPRAYLQQSDQELRPDYVRYMLPTSEQFDTVVFRLILADDASTLDMALQRYSTFAWIRRSGGGWVGVGASQLALSDAAQEMNRFIVSEAQSNAEEQGQLAIGRIVGVIRPDDTGVPLLVDLSANS